MILSEEKREEMERVAKPVMAFLRDIETFHPHMKIVIDGHFAELLEGVCTVNQQYVLQEANNGEV